MTAIPEPLTLTAGSITQAQRLSKLLCVNALGRAVLEDKRAPAPLRAATPAPNATPRPRPGLTTADYLQAHEAERRAALSHRDAVQAVLDAERYQPDAVPAAILSRLNAERRHRAAEVDLRCVEATIRADLAPPARPGHLTAYRFTLPTVQYVHPEYGLHALSEPHSATVDTAALEGDDLGVFLEFMREFPGKGAWPLYAPHTRDGLQKVGLHCHAAPARALFERLIEQHPGSVPKVYPAQVAREVLGTA